MLVFVPRLTNRMGYTLKVVFHHMLQMDYTITTDAEFYRSSDDMRLCYGDTPLDESPFLCAKQLLFSSTVEDQDLKPFSHNGLMAIFPTYDRTSILPFDLFAATFYMVSRYEEYMPHHIDDYGRFPASESVAHRLNILDTPIVDHWALLLHRTLRQHYPNLPETRRRYGFTATIDIDAAYCYRNKGILRTLAGIARDMGNHELLRERFRVLTRRQADPFDTFDYLLEQQRSHPSIKMVFFALLGDYGKYDKPIAYTDKSFRELLQHLSDYAKVGIHTSFQASENPKLVHVETQRLADILHRPIVRNRYHYLRIRLPQAYRQLTHEGILHDYTMGYAETPGFRSGTATAYPFYDLERDEESALTIHPFCVMDTTLIRHQSLSPEQAFSVYRNFIDQIKAVNSTFYAIWHNQNICDNPEWSAWRSLFEQVLAYGDPNNAT